MPKTEVILTQNIVGLGGESDQIKVAPGYARNYLFPQGLAIPVTGANKRRLEALRQRRAEREAHELTSMTELAKGLSKLVLLIKVKTGEEGKMFGSVTAGTIADEVKHQFDVALEKKKIHLAHPIRTLGEHEVELRLHAEVVLNLKVKIESTTPSSKAEPAAASASGKEATGTSAEARKNQERPEAKRERGERKAEAERKPRAEKKEKTG